MKKNNIIFLISILVIIVISAFVILFSIKKGNDVGDNTNKLMTKEEYYNELVGEMKKVYEEYYKNISVPETYDDITLVIKLGQLEQDGVDIKDFVSYKNNVPCDKLETYAKYKLNDGKYDLNIYYRCDNDSNYSEESHYKVNLN